MSMMEIHASAVKSVCAAYHEFLLMYKADAQQVYGIVEGRGDPLFYRGFIEGCLPDGWTVELIPADGKSNVISAYQIIDWKRFPKERVGLFIDRDLSEFITEFIPADHNVYVTEGYAIENDIVNFGTFRRFVEEVLNISRLSQVEISQLENFFNSSCQVVRESLSPLMAQIILWRKLGKRPCLSDFSPSCMFEMTAGSISLRQDFLSIGDRVQKFAEIVGEAASSDADIALAEAEFKAKDGERMFVRGKYLLEIMIFLALELRGSLAAVLPSRTKAPKMNVSVGQGNAMVFVAPRCRIPKSLSDFVTRTFDCYIASRIKVTAGAIG